MIKKWLRRKKAQLMKKWAAQFGLHIVEIKRVGRTEYLVDNKGAWRKLARRSAV